MQTRILVTAWRSRRSTKLWERFQSMWAQYNPVANSYQPARSRTRAPSPELFRPQRSAPPIPIPGNPLSSRGTSPGRQLQQQQCQLLGTAYNSRAVRTPTSFSSFSPGFTSTPSSPEQRRRDLHKVPNHLRKDSLHQSCNDNWLSLEKSWRQPSVDSTPSPQQPRRPGRQDSLRGASPSERCLGLAAKPREPPTPPRDPSMRCSTSTNTACPSNTSPRQCRLALSTLQENSSLATENPATPPPPMELMQVGAGQAARPKGKGPRSKKPRQSALKHLCSGARCPGPADSWRSQEEQALSSSSESDLSQEDMEVDMTTTPEVSRQLEETQCLELIRRLQTTTCQQPATWQEASNRAHILGQRLLLTLIALRVDPAEPHLRRSRVQRALTEADILQRSIMAWWTSPLLQTTRPSSQ